MVKINIKPLSVNRAYNGRRFATDELKSYKEVVWYLLPNIIVPKGRLSISYEFGVSSKGADGDNLIKAIQDILSSKYDFNDNLIYEWSGKKVIVKKGQEYINFAISSYSE